MRISIKKIFHMVRKYRGQTDHQRQRMQCPLKVSSVNLSLLKITRFIGKRRLTRKTKTNYSKILQYITLNKLLLHSLMKSSLQLTPIFVSSEFYDLTLLACFYNIRLYRLLPGTCIKNIICAKF